MVGLMREYRFVFRFGVAMLVSMAVLLTAMAAWTAVPLKPKGIDGPAVAVAVIDGQMELTRKQVVFYDFPEARLACAEAAWRPEMHHALAVLMTEPMLTVMAEQWRDAWGTALMACYRGDMATANGHIEEAYDLRDSLWEATT